MTEQPPIPSWVVFLIGKQTLEIELLRQSQQEGKEPDADSSTTK